MLKRLKNAPNILYNMGSEIKFPEKFKGTIIEKWADYWKNLVIDYRQMLQELRTDIQDDPRKALRWSVGIVTLTALARNNPSEIDFRDYVKRINNEAALVSEDCLNPKSVEHLAFLDVCYNQGVIHFQSLGIASFMYTSELNDNCDLFKKHCTYTQPSYLSFPSRIVDIGFMGKWWNTHIKTTNYDVNFTS